MKSLLIGRVLNFHPHDSSCDIQLMTDGAELTGVPVLCGMVTTSSGGIDLHEPEGNAYNQPGSATRDEFAVVGWVGPCPVVLGFLAPQISQVLFDRKNFKVERHASDVYSTINATGDVELAHPSGTFLRIGASPAHEDLTGQDFDASWKISRNTAAAVWLSISIANAGSVVATLQIDPSGNVSLTNSGNLTVNTTGNAALTAAALVINAPTTINGATNINGATTITGGLSDNGVNVGSSHVHGGVKAGTDNSAVPH